MITVLNSVQGDVPLSDDTMTLPSEDNPLNIDKHGQGTAEYACECIKKYLA